MFYDPHNLKEKDVSFHSVSYGADNSNHARIDKVKTVSGVKASPKADWVDHIRLIKAHGDQAAFADLFHHFAPRVKSFLIKSGASDSMADEITQDVMATIWTKAHMFDPTRAGVSTWIFTIARNRKIDVLRKQRRPEPEDLTWGQDYEPDQEDVLALQEETQHLSNAIDTLPATQKDLVQRAYYNDLSHSEIAQQTGLPLGTIKSRLRLAINHLRNTMK